jgi:hypothetical protein
VTVLEESITKKQRSVVCFLCNRTQCKGYSLRNVSFLWWEVFVALLRKIVHSWVEKFSQGHLKVADDVQPGCLAETATEATVQGMEELIQADRRITTDSNCTRMFPSFSIQNYA